MLQPIEILRTADVALLETLGLAAPHDHLCSIYETREERLAVAVAFIRVGLTRGEQCIYVVDDDEQAALRQAMMAAGIDVDDAVQSGRFRLETTGTTYLKGGTFNAEWMSTFWAQATDDARRQGFPALRVAGDTEWVIRSGQHLESWLEYESRFNSLIRGLDCVALCQYSRRLFPAELICDILRTHPVVIYRGVVARNLYHVPPDELIAPNQAEREVERLLSNIRDRQQVEDSLRRQRNELQESEARWRLVFDNSAIGIVLADEQGNFVEANRAFQDLVGYADHELRRLNYADITHTADIASGEAVVGALVSGAKLEVQLEKRYRHKDGRFIWVRATGTKIPATDRSPVYLLGLVEDATMRKATEQERDASVGQLRALAGRLMHVQDAERRRIARMLHETAAQDLAALKMHLGRLNRAADHLSDSDRAALIESVALVDHSITEIRTMSYLLHPPFLDEMGLLSALRWYAAGFTERSGIKVDLELPDSFERLPLDTETALFRIVQESLSNIHRHAASETAGIRLQRNDRRLVLEIEDHGRGISQPLLAQINTGSGVGVGIAGMRERIEQLGGRLELTSIERRTIVRAVLPIRN